MRVMLILAAAKENCCYEIEFEMEDEWGESVAPSSEQIWETARDLLGGVTLEMIPMPDESAVMLVDEDAGFYKTIVNEPATRMNKHGYRILGDAVIAALDYDGELREFVQNPYKGGAK